MKGTPRGAYTTACHNNASLSNKEGTREIGGVGGNTSNMGLSVISWGRTNEYKSNERDLNVRV